jgi:hypothetical protein
MAARYSSVAIRYGEHIAPREGTVAAHQTVVDRAGYAWYGKFGLPLSEQRLALLMSQRDDGRLLLFLLCKWDLTLAEVDQVARTIPPSELAFVPAYYREKFSDVGTWLRVRRFVPLSGIGIATQLRIQSSGRPLSEAISSSASPMFYVTVDEDVMCSFAKTGLD